MNNWIKFVKEYQQQHNISYKQALKEAKEHYQNGGSVQSQAVSRFIYKKGFNPNKVKNASNFIKNAEYKRKQRTPVQNQPEYEQTIEELEAELQRKVNWGGSLNANPDVLLSNVQIAKFIDNVYKPKPIKNIDNWTLDSQLTDKFHKVYVNQVNQLVVLCIAGTIDLQDWKNNISYVFSQYQQTERFKNSKQVLNSIKLKYGNFGIILIGHSQSAITTRLLSKDKQVVKSYSLNGAEKLNEKQNEKMVKIRTHNDIISSLGKDNSITIKGNRHNPLNVLGNHSTQSLKEQKKIYF